VSFSAADLEQFENSTFFAVVAVVVAVVAVTSLIVDFRRS
jgi:hypothetical protein